MTPATPATPPPCAPIALSVNTDGEGGALDGMSHSGALLVVRNIGPDSCSLPALPTLMLEDRVGRALPARRTPPVGMHPGPVMVPLALAVGAEATSSLRWISGPVYPHNRCLTPSHITVRFGASSISTPWPGDSICGEAGAPLGFDQPPLRLDPRVGEP
jgi:hypothetical protein